MPITETPSKWGGARYECQTSIGQGTTQITPLHNAILTAIANGGTLMKPYFLSSVESAGGEEIKKVYALRLWEA